MPATGGENAYDAVPYLVRSYPQSYPNRLATLGLLFGLTPAPVDRCRVLELGCGSGNNLIPMAETLPGSQFVGIDLSARQIHAGQAAVAELGLHNISLAHLDILEVDAAWGQFDYIIAHGIYSWVPEPVQDHILSICQRNLAPNGIAYISYNTNPGWRVLGIIRDLMLFHTAGISDPALRAERTLTLLDFLAESATQHNVVDGRVAAAALHFKHKLDELGGDAPNYLLHELLEEVNTPVYFAEFVARAAGHGLQFLSEADLSDIAGSPFPEAVERTLRDMASDMIEREQYKDFLRNEAFRRTLLCHQDITLDRTLRPELLRHFHVASRARPVSDDPDIHSVSVERFRGPNAASLATDHPPSKAAMLHLSDVWPRAIAFDALLDAAYERLEVDPEPEVRVRDAVVLSSNLLRAYSYSTELVNLHLHAPRIAAGVSRRPVARPVARFQARERAEVTNAYHEVVKLDAPSQLLLPLLDGSRDREVLRIELERLVAEGMLVLQRDDAPAEDGIDVEGMLSEELDQLLAFLAYSALLVD